MELPSLSLNYLNELIKEQDKIIKELYKKNKELEFSILLHDNKISELKYQIEIIFGRISQ